MEMKDIDLTKCNNLRYKAKIDGNEDYGRICVENADTGLAFLRSDREDGYIAAWHCDEPGVEGCSTILLTGGGHVVANSKITVLRPATEEERQKLFDAMAKGGKRWNAEKKVVEDIPKPYEFRYGEPVLVRNGACENWGIASYCRSEGTMDKVYVGSLTAFFMEIIPYNEKTMHLLGTTEDYKEE